MDPVAALRIQVPPVDFVLRGTIPVPKGTYFPGGPRSLLVVDGDGGVIDDTQIEVVSRYPDPADGADVVEVIARVKPGFVQRYDVVSQERSPGPDPGTPDVLDLIGGPKDLPPTIQLLVADPDAILVVATDPLGHRYVARPLRGQGSVRLQRYGPYMATVRTYETTEPDDPASLPPGAYPHMMGVHSYMSTVAAEDALLLSLRFNNGSDGFDAVDTDDDLIGDLYFDQLDLYLIDNVAQWSMQQDFLDPFVFNPMADTPGQATLGGRSYRVFPIVKKHPQSQGVLPMHILPCKSQFVRRVVLSPIWNTGRARALLDEGGLGYAAVGQNGAGQPYWSWWNENTARYFPQRTRLPRLAFTNGLYGGQPDLRVTLNSWLVATRDALAQDGPLAPPEGTGATAQLGWARPLGSPNGNTSGGAGVQYFDGERTLAVASTPGYRYLQLRHRLHTDRMPNVVWGLDGDASCQDKWLQACTGGCNPNVFPPGVDGVTPSYTSVQYDMDIWSLDPTFCTPAGPWAQNTYVATNGLEPWYETHLNNFLNITDFGPHNMAHHTRFSRLPLALTWIGNDPLARDDVVSQAEMFRFTYTEYPNAAGSHTAVSLAADRQFVLTLPGWGYDTGRDEGWGIHIVNAAFAISDDAWRARVLPWYDLVVQTMERGMGHATDPNFIDPMTAAPYPWGVLIALQSNKLYGVGGGIPRGRQVWEEMILQNSIRGALQSVFTPADPSFATAETILRESYYGIVSPVSWNESQQHIHETCPVTGIVYSPPPGNLFDCDPTAYPCAGSNPLPAPPFLPFDRDDNYAWAALGDAALFTGDALFLQRALETLTGGSCSTGCEATLASQIESIGDPTKAADYALWSNRSALLGRVQ